MRKSAKRSNCFSSSPMGKWTRSTHLGKRMVRGRSRQVISEKLESLRNLIPSGGKGIATLPATERLLQETADYITRLRSQVAILQVLVHLYGPLPSSAVGLEC
ncbi:hypothetical protein SAY87_008926 [Trapa incisa]|uniref:BHLH domain-containing protein n=1 Tax=Trapa incisa TaxID=236973 RepID=A0AAN7JX07_9MYRT|nr:hypothetical protein SAY87_008926 [Trapa incisa]